MKENEVILYRIDEKNSSEIEVRIENETVWLSQSQMTELFDATKQNISLHINNIFKEKELVKNSVVKYSLTTASDGKKYNTAYYNLDVIISVGYRVKSKRGTQFRIWANAILKEYLLKGYALNQRIERIENKVLEQGQQIEMLIQTALPPREGIFYDGQIYDAWIFASDLIKSAEKSIILIDNYIDETVLTLLSKRKKGIKAEIYTKKIAAQLQLDIEKHNVQYEKILVKEFSKSHDRFLILDQKEIYLIGASLKDLGKKWFAFSKINLDTEEFIKKLN